MNAPRYRAWRFLHPDLDLVGVGPAGLRLSPSGGIAMVQEEASVRQNSTFMQAPPLSRRPC